MTAAVVFYFFDFVGDCCLYIELYWIKHVFYEAQLDFFGKHMFDLKSEPVGEPETGHHHYEWRPA